MKPSSFRLLLTLLITLLIGGFIGYEYGTNRVAYDWKHLSVSTSSKEPPPGMQNLDFSPMYTVLNDLEQGYYDKKAIDPQKLVNGAITGMVSSVGDPYTLYLPPVQNTNFKQQLAGQFTGIGAELGLKGKNIVVISPLDGSPAQKSGVRAGDQITSVDGQQTSGWTLDQVVTKIRGPKGTAVKLGLNRNGQDSQVTITRDVIQVKSVVGWVKKVPDIEGIKVADHANDKIAYVRLSQFGDTANQDWVSVINKLNLQIKSDSSVKGMIFDLRNNPGGYLTDAQFIASEFLQSGDTIVKEDNGAGDVQTLSVSRKGLFIDQPPLIVLINKGSASAAEITAGALRDNDRAKLLGENSFGKGTVQQAQDLGAGAGLHVTVARWLTPSGFWVGNGKDGTGLTPDYKVTLDPKDPSHDTQLEKAVELLVSQ